MEIINQQKKMNWIPQGFFLLWNWSGCFYWPTKRNTLTVGLDADKHWAKACRKWACLPSVSHWLLNQTERDRQGQHPTATGLLFCCNEGDREGRENYPVVNTVKSSQQSNKKIHTKPNANTPILLLGGEHRHTSCSRTLSSLAVEADTGKVQ